MKNPTESDYRNYFRSMLLDFLENQLGIELPEKFVAVRSQFAAKIYLAALGKGKRPAEALNQAQQLLFKGFQIQTAETT